MPKLAEKNQCTGCTACVSICPRNCIQMKKDNAGFEFPVIMERSACIACGACERVCPVLMKKKDDENLSTSAYAAFSNNNALRLESSSGGIFSELAATILQRGGVIYGASYDDEGVVRHIEILLFLGITTCQNLDQSKHSLSYSSYQIPSDKIDTQIRIVQLTDLHNSEFGEDNQELIDRIASQSPDLILLTGDLLNSGEPVTEIATNLISSLCEIAPVYLSLGNHEIEYQDNFGTDITQLYQDAGAIVLEHQYRDITVKGQSLRIGGIYGYCLPDKYLETEEADLSECMFLWDFENTDRYKILLSHLPIAWLKNDALEEWNVDCVFSGHLHGGQVILPGIGGVYAPDMGWFPGRLKGVFDSEDGKRHLVLSAGLGNTEVIPRFNNIPEIVCVDLVPEGGW